jgi:hypothetical protein
MALDDEPAKLTEKLKEEITEEEPINDMVKPEGIISPADVERDYEETASLTGPEETTYIKTANAEERKRALERVRKRKTKTKRKAPGIAESRSLSKLHTELRKHSNARKKTDLAIRDIEKQLKSLLLAHHSAIRDLKKEVTQLRKSIAAAESRKITKKTQIKKKGNKQPSRKTGS